MTFNMKCFNYLDISKFLKFIFWLHLGMEISECLQEIRSFTYYLLLHYSYIKILGFYKLSICTGSIGPSN